MKLTDKQDNVAICFTLNNNNKTQAYRDSFDCENMSTASIYVEACNLAKNPKVAIRIDELRKERFSGKVLSVEERKVLLSELSSEGDIKALDILNKMEGIYIEKKQLELSGPEGKPIETKWTVEFVEAKDEQSSDTK